MPPRALHALEGLDRAVMKMADMGINNQQGTFYDISEMPIMGRLDHTRYFARSASCATTPSLLQRR